LKSKAFKALNAGLAASTSQPGHEGARVGIFPGLLPPEYMQTYEKEEQKRRAPREDLSTLTAEEKVERRGRDRGRTHGRGSSGGRDRRRGRWRWRRRDRSGGRGRRGRGRGCGRRHHWMHHQVEELELVGGFLPGHPAGLESPQNAE